MSHHSSSHTLTCICGTTRRNSFSPNCCFNDQISSHSNQGQLHVKWMPSCIHCLRLSLTDGAAATIRSQQYTDCISFVSEIAQGRSLSACGSTAQLPSSSCLSCSTLSKQLQTLIKLSKKIPPSFTKVSLAYFFLFCLYPVTGEWVRKTTGKKKQEEREQ